MRPSDWASPALPVVPARVVAAKSYRFVVVVAGTPSAEQVAALPDRPLVSRRVGPGVGEVAFRRSRGDLMCAVLSAVHDLDAIGLQAVRVLHDDWVTLADIADRIGRSRETVRLWTTGRLGPGGFPPALNPNRDTSFYSWVEVSAWLRQQMGMRVRSDPGLVAADLVVRLRALPGWTDRLSLLGNCCHQAGTVEGMPSVRSGRTH